MKRLFGWMLCPLLAAGTALADGPKLAPSPLPTVKVTIPHTTAVYEMVKVPAGKVVVDGKEIEVKPFWIGRTEVSWDCFDTWAYGLDLSDAEKAKGTDANQRPSKPYGPPDEGWGREGYPAMRMAYEGVIFYTEYLSKQTGKKFRLPTEAEWVYAAQANTGRKTPANLDKEAWYRNNSDKKTHPIATKDPNPWGLYDVFGNVGEFVQQMGDDKVIKGGTYRDPAAKITTDHREAWTEDWQSRDPQDPKSKWWMSDGPFAGFRLAMDDTGAQASIEKK